MLQIIQRSMTNCMTNVCCKLYKDQWRTAWRMYAANYTKINNELHDECTLQIISKINNELDDECTLKIILKIKDELNDECTLQIISKIKDDCMTNVRCKLYQRSKTNCMTNVRCKLYQRRTTCRMYAANYIKDQRRTVWWMYAVNYIKDQRSKTNCMTNDFTQPICKFYLKPTCLILGYQSTSIPFQLLIVAQSFSLFLVDKQ